MNVKMKPFFPRYSLTDVQQKLIDDAAAALPATDQHLFRLRVSRIIRSTVSGAARDSDVRVAVNAARRDFAPMTRRRA
jgi:hypothetical protein